MVDFVSVFQTVATSINCEFNYGRNDYIEAQLNATQIEKCSGLLYIEPMIITPQINSGVIGYRLYNTVIAICKLGKLSDNYEDKYFLRLKELNDLMEETLELLTGCSTDFELISAKIYNEVNKFSEVFDVVLCEITFSDE